MINDNEIIELIKINRQDKAFNKLYNYYPACKKLIKSKGGSDDDALDIYQDALTILCRNVKKNDFKLTSSLNTYLYSICKFSWNDEIKKRARSKFQTHNNLLSFDEIDLDEKFTDNERKIELAKKALYQISQRCMELFQLFYFQKLDMKTIAEKMNFSSENVAKNQKYKCLENAKNKFNQLSQLPNKK